MTTQKQIVDYFDSTLKKYDTAEENKNKRKDNNNEFSKSINSCSNL